MTMASGSQTSKTCRICDKDLDPGGGSYSGLYGEAPPERGAFFSSQISCKVEEMVAEAKYIKRCHILAKLTTQLNQNEAITGNSIVLA